MSAPTPTGPIAVAVDGLRTLIANLPIFQTITGAASAAAALPSVFVAELGWPIVKLTAGVSSTTITLPRIHSVLVGDTVTIQGAALGGQSQAQLDGSHTVIQIGAFEVVVGSTTIDPGEYTPDQALLIPGERPFAIVSEPADGGLKSTTIGTGGASVLSGMLEILLECDVTAEYCNIPTYAQTEMRNTAGELLRQLIQTQGTGDFIVLNNAELVSCEFTAAPEQDDTTLRYERWRALIRCSWGLDG